MQHVIMKMISCELKIEGRGPQRSCATVVEDMIKNELKMKKIACYRQQDLGGAGCRAR